MADVLGHVKQPTQVRPSLDEFLGFARTLQPAVVVWKDLPHSFQDPPAVAERLRSALDLMAAGAALVRQRMRHEHPGLSPEEVDAHMLGWLRDRPADSPGRSVSWPRSKS
jgi:hypothetical protein